MMWCAVDLRQFYSNWHLEYVNKAKLKRSEKSRLAAVKTTHLENYVRIRNFQLNTFVVQLSYLQVTDRDLF